MNQTELTRISSADTPDTQTMEDAWLGWRYAAATTAKRNDPGIGDPFNDDAYLVHHVPDALYLCVVDVATRKSGITGANIQAAIISSFVGASSNASPAEIIAAAHTRLSKDMERRSAKGGACLLIVRAAANGECNWAHVGDGVMLRWKSPRRWFAKSHLELLNTRQRKGQGLLFCVGMRRVPTPLIEEGSFIARPGERLLIASDGIFHDAMETGQLKAWIDAHQRIAPARLTSDLVRKIDVEARLSEPIADDRTLIILERPYRLYESEKGAH